MNERQLFFQHLAQTSPTPLALEIVRAEGIYQYDKSGKAYIDLIAGFSVMNIGHSHPKVIAAVEAQLKKYAHLIVYGEFIQTPQVAYAQLLTAHLPKSLNMVYFTNSGAEAVEGAMKLAKRATRKTKIIAANKAYHGSTQGALSLMGDEYWRNAYRPLLPDIFHYDFGSQRLIDAIDKNTAAVVIEIVQAEAGVKSADKGWFQQLAKKCKDLGTLLIVDEIQSGFGRTGNLWAFEAMGIVPDILLLGKALGGGLPLGAFIADKKLMELLTYNPVLGHITTFGGNPVSCAAGQAAFEVLLATQCFQKEKAIFLHQQLQHPLIKAKYSAGLWMAIEFETADIVKKIVLEGLKKGLITDWFLFAPNCIRIAPPLIISFDELKIVTDILNGILDTMVVE